MPILIILFLLSLAGIMVMIGRKLVLLRKGEAMTLSEQIILIELPDIEDLKKDTKKKIRRYGYVTLIIGLRVYLISSNLLKKKYSEIKDKAKVFINKYVAPKMKVREEQKQEVSKFLKRVSEYKNKIDKIKNRIKEEEGFE